MRVEVFAFNVKPFVAVAVVPASVNLTETSLPPTSVTLIALFGLILPYLMSEFTHHLQVY